MTRIEELAVEYARALQNTSFHAAAYEVAQERVYKTQNALIEEARQLESGYKQTMKEGE